MKKSKYLVLIFLIILTGCENFLDKEPLDIISDALVWEDENLINSYLADLYYRTDFMERKGNDDCVSLCMIASMGGEGRSYGAHHQPYIASTNVITAAGPNAQLDYWNYKNIRDCNFFIEKMDNNPNFDQAYNKQRIAEVRFLRAYMYFEMVKRFGGVPIIVKAQAMDATEEELYLPRNSEKEVYDFIIAEMDTLSQELPNEYSAEDKGRPTKWAALALKSRAALYAASIAKYGQVQLDGLLGFQSSDVEYYADLSYDASKAIINNGIHFLYEKQADPVLNYQNLFLDESSDNKEVIMSEVYDYAKNRAHAFSLRTMPHDFSGTWASMYYLYDFVERFEFADGSPGNSISRSQLTATGSEWTPAELWENRDARFRATVFYPESPWQGGKVLFHSSTIRGGVTYTSGFAEDGWPYKASTRNTTKTGFMVRKRCNESMKMPTDVFNDQTDVIIFRLGEIYLNLAEAAYYLNFTDEALTTLNRLRERANMPPKTTIDEATIQNERLVELSWENHSYWDIRRWRIAKQLLDGVRTQGLVFTYNYDTKKYRIRLIAAEGVARIFQDRNYYLPLGVSRVAENPNFVENPDY
ncbi:MAG: RagB/SusD family nutrient uptake outer membrane protein [Bacteroidales bacterium]|nr:RagB/SusD family nutrient uptake outer membrane protein [Bacteroidales bacterium]